MKWVNDLTNFRCLRENKLNTVSFTFDACALGNNSHKTTNILHESLALNINIKCIFQI